MYWFDEHAQEILKKIGTKLVVATGITPSGPIHIGNLREILTADFVVKALADKAKITFYYIADDFDPLRKVYPFLDKSYEAHIGKPYFLIPCPCGKHASYADHFMAPFLTAIKALGVDATLLPVSRLYRAGRYTNAITKVIEGREKIKAILEETSQRRVGDDWFPFNPLCRTCQKLRGKVTDFDLKNHTVSYECPDCGGAGVADFSKGEGKLPWRIDWPARWWMLGVNVEPFGKDHASPGGSYETGERIAKAIFDSPAPYPIVYERVHLRGEGAMHSSTGLAIEASKILKAVSPTVIRFFFAKSQADRHINFDPGEGVIQLYDEYRILKPSDPAYKIATVEPLPDVPYRHLVMIYQASAKSTDAVLQALERTHHSVKDAKILEPLLKRIDVWLERYSPDRYKFTVQTTLPAGAKTLTVEQKHFLNELLALVESKDAWTGEDLHAKIHDLRKAQDIPPQAAFAAIYQIFLGQDSGPQVGWFLAAIDRAFVIERLQQVQQTIK